MQIRVLDATAIREVLSMDRCIELMRRAFEMVATGETIQPVRQALGTPDGRGVVGWMPGYTARPEWLGIKVISVFPGNFGTAFGSHQGMVLLFEAAHGSPVAVLEAGTLTAIRTAAATAVATDVLAPAGARSLGILGYGEQAETHIDALLRVRPFELISIWGRDLHRAARFAARSSERFGVRAVAVADAREAAHADVICAVTAATDPILHGAWLHAGQHLNLVGSSVPTAAEADEETIARGRLFVDFRESALALSGEFRRAKARGLVTDEAIVGCVGDVIVGKVAARAAPTDITVFKSLGMASEDLVASDFVYREAARRGLGVLLDWSSPAESH
ncbi:MAG TPA: ornithine cyclodeaminase family protein [Steroidobacteraceae bacterium]|nr:ornithine cyclodeaminase family protein [Steroidobacteraceae bacterium]